LAKIILHQTKIKTMKKYFVLIIAICISIGAAAQMGKVTAANSFIDQNALDKAKEAIDVALVNEKSMNNPKTFATKGKLCQEVFKSDNPKFKALYANPLDDAYAAYEKALELDPKGNIKKQFSINSTYLLLANDFITQGGQKYEAKEYEAALKSFEMNIKISASEIYIGVTDSAIYFNAGLAAYNGKMYDKAIPHFKKCTELKYEPVNSYLLEFQSYIFLEDKANAEATLRRGFTEYPDNQDLLLNLVDFYMKNDKIKEAFANIEIAKVKDPNNYSLHWAEGVLYMKQEKFTEAIECLTKSVAINGELYETQYNLAVCYYNKAVEMLSKANEIMDATKYNVAAAEANAVFVTAIPYFEKASSLRPEDVDALRNLKELYFRLRTVKPEYETKYAETVKKLEGK
jgi:tetratricopeptide (TPR) repeat protein